MKKSRVAGLTLLFFLGSTLPAQAVDQHYSGLRTYKDNKLVASGYGKAYLSSNQAWNEAFFKDERDDSYGAYARAQFQGWDYGCNPGTNVCYYRWGHIVEKQTQRYKTSDGLRKGYLTTPQAGVKWRVSSSVCVDVAYASDPCDWSSYLYPYG